MLNTILITVSITFTFDWVCGFFVKKSLVKKQAKIDDDFLKNLEIILKNKSLSGKIRKAKALELCRMTKGEISAGAFFALFDIEFMD